MDAEFCVFSFSLKTSVDFLAKRSLLVLTIFIKSVRFIRHVAALDVRSARFGKWSQKYQMQTMFLPENQLCNNTCIVSAGQKSF